MGSSRAHSALGMQMLENKSLVFGGAGWGGAVEHESSQHRPLSTLLEFYPELQSVGAALCADGAHPRVPIPLLLDAGKSHRKSRSPVQVTSPGHECTPVGTFLTQADPCSSLSCWHFLDSGIQNSSDSCLTPFWHSLMRLGFPLKMKKPG